LTLQVGPDRGKVFPLNKPEMVIGRDSSVDIVINDVEVSRKHAHLILQPGGYLIEDLGSTNGTIVNGTRLTGFHHLQAEEEISLGEHIILVFEVVPVDLDATQISRAAAPRQTATTITSSNPVQSTLAQNPLSASYSGNLPLGPIQDQPGQDKKRFPTWAIILIIVTLVVICACIGILYFIDANSLWCSVLPFISGCP
jgi:predicted component of type VI protein secretion system